MSIIIEEQFYQATRVGNFRSLIFLFHELQHNW
jgi:hypothetical protein